MTTAPIQRVLIVDDAEELRSLVRLRLERSQLIEVVGEAGDGEEAVELARALRPDVVVLDVAMPKMDGLEALPLIRSALPAVRVIVLSGFNEGTMKEAASRAGADHYLVKGTPLVELVALVEGG